MNHLPSGGIPDSLFALLKQGNFADGIVDRSFDNPLPADYQDGATDSPRVGPQEIASGSLNTISKDVFGSLGFLAEYLDRQTGGIR